jgi:hypothetical protein
MIDNNSSNCWDEGTARYVLFFPMSYSVFFWDIYKFIAQTANPRVWLT